LKNEILLPNDEIISQGTLGDQMYFIIKGRLSVFIEKKVDIYAIRAIPGLELFVPFSL
jgi:CRP-like cAMP-binding protein